MKTIYFSVLFFSYICCALCEESGVTPIVLWHGMGDSCCFPFSLGAFKDKLNKTLGTYIYSIEIGSNVIEDVENGFFKHPSEQIEEACKILSADPKLANGFNAIGFSQGAQFLRGLIQRCPTVKVRSLISLGGQHQGVYGLPRCGALSISLCDYLRKLLNHAAYIEARRAGLPHLIKYVVNSVDNQVHIFVVQKTLVQATYWHDPLDEETYKKESTFLADINNERTINVDYIARLQLLEHFVLVKFENDTMVEPVESEWFGFYKPGQSVEVESLEDSAFYNKDRLGLKKFIQESRIHFLSVEGDHLRFPWSWFEEYIINIFLKN